MNLVGGNTQYAWPDGNYIELTRENNARGISWIMNDNFLVFHIGYPIVFNKLIINGGIGCQFVVKKYPYGAWWYEVGGFTVPASGKYKFDITETVPRNDYMLYCTVGCSDKIKFVGLYYV